MAETTSVDEIVEAYLSAVNERNRDAREKLLDAAVTDDFVFTGVMRQTQGREAFNRLLGEILSASPEEDGETITRMTEVDAHHGWVHFRWALRSAQGVVVTTPEGEQMAGWYTGQLGPDGRLERIIVFLGSGAEGTKTSGYEGGEQSGEQAGGEPEGGTTTTPSGEAQEQRSTTTLGDLTARPRFDTGDEG